MNRINYPEMYPELSEDKIQKILEHCERYDLEPDVCAYYEDIDDFYSDWCDDLGYTEEEADEMLDSYSGEFIEFDGWGILRFVR